MRNNLFAGLPLVLIIFIPISYWYFHTNRLEILFLHSII